MKKILIIDDDQGNLEVMALIFLEVGYRVEAVSCEAELWKVIDSFYPDLIFIDILLGGTNGVELCSRLKQHLGNNKLKIAILSACDKNLEAAEQDSCANDYISKPFDVDQIMELAHRLLEQ